MVDQYNPFQDLAQPQGSTLENVPIIPVVKPEFQQPQLTVTSYRQARPQPQNLDLPNEIKEIIEELNKPEKTLTPTPEPAPTPQPKENITINQPFGNPNPKLYGYSNGKPNINRGVDLSAQPGELQSAPPKGKWVVVSTYTGNGFNTGWGRSVVIKNTETGETIRRSHLDKVFVKPGQEVTGKPLGTTGMTGRTTGYHKDVEYTNPQGKLSDYTKTPYFRYEGKISPSSKKINIKSLIQKYFPKEEWDRAYNVMMGESSGNVKAVGDKHPINGILAPSYGLFQIRGLPGRPSPSQLLNPEFNVKYAADMWRKEGWSPWTAARKLGYVR